jgi:hypothetical protein
MRSNRLFIRNAITQTVSKSGFSRILNLPPENILEKLGLWSILLDLTKLSPGHKKYGLKLNREMWNFEDHPSDMLCHSDSLVSYCIWHESRILNPVQITIPPRKKKNTFPSSLIFSLNWVIVPNYSTVAKPKTFTSRNFVNSPATVIWWHLRFKFRLRLSLSLSLSPLSSWSDNRHPGEGFIFTI